MRLIVSLVFIIALHTLLQKNYVFTRRVASLFAKSFPWSLTLVKRHRFHMCCFSSISSVSFSLSILYGKHPVLYSHRLNLDIAYRSLRRRSVRALYFLIEQKGQNISFWNMICWTKREVHLLFFFQLGLTENWSWTFFLSFFFTYLRYKNIFH